MSCKAKKRSNYSCNLLRARSGIVCNIPQDVHLFYNKIACLFVCLFVSEISEKSRFSDSSRSYYALERYEMDLLKDFQTNWFEVAIWFDLKTKHGAPFLLSRDHSLESFPANSSSDVRHTKIRRSPGYSNSEKGVISLSVPS